MDHLWLLEIITRKKVRLTSPYDVWPLLSSLQLLFRLQLRFLLQLLFRQLLFSQALLARHGKNAFQQ
ncbi:hypothetical protein LINGRAHAP2_LOCUS23752, partial [Linum grandiflorum]